MVKLSPLASTEALLEFDPGVLPPQAPELFFLGGGGMPASLPAVRRLVVGPVVADPLAQGFQMDAQAVGRCR
ncbi:hypothetical protein ACFW2Y_29575 [Streptomyces sp. NPDC058877]|uniref:hypothetical protein n=1 Tax=unclassified Streptomyces TaxID=2593676 RepID=UPI00369DEE58